MAANPVPYPKLPASTDAEITNDDIIAIYDAGTGTLKRMTVAQFLSKVNVGASPATSAAAVTVSSGSFTTVTGANVQAALASIDQRLAQLPLGYKGKTAGGPPTTGTYAAGDFVSAPGQLWVCSVAGSPGTWVSLTAVAPGGGGTEEPPPTPDTTAPSTPTGLTVTGTGPTSIVVTWTPATDNIGVVGYRVYRDNGLTPIGNPSGSSFTDNNVVAATSYSYQVTAVDAAGNESPKQTAVSGSATAPAGGVNQRAVSTTITYDTTGNPRVTIPAGAVSGDLAVAAIAGPYSGTLATPSGWTKQLGTTGNLAVYTKTLGAGEGGTTVTFTATPWALAATLTSGVTRGPVATSAPAGATVVNPGDNIGQKIEDARVTTAKTVYFNAGTYNNVKKALNTGSGGHDGMTFMGANGAILDGTNTTDFGFYGAASNITIRNLEFKNYVPGLQLCGPVNPYDPGTSGTSNWVVEDCSIHNISHSAINLVNGSVVRRCKLYDIAQCAIQSGNDNVSDTIIEDNEIYNINIGEPIDKNWHAGGVKLTQAVRPIVRRNYVHNCEAAGIWCDINTHEATIVDNYVATIDFYGIMYEISFGPTLIARNYVTGVGSVGAEYGGIYISNSSGCTVRQNRVTASRRGIVSQETDRFDQTPDTGSAFLLRDLLVEQNRIDTIAGLQASVWWTPTTPATPAGRNLLFRANSYDETTGTDWDYDGALNFAGWQALGFDQAPQLCYAAAAVYDLGNVHATTPVHALGTLSADTEGTSAATSGPTTTVPNALAIAFVGEHATAAPSFNVSGSDWAEVTDSSAGSAPTGGVGTGVGLSSATQVRPSVGAVGAATFTSTVSGRIRAVSLAIAPAAGGGTGATFDPRTAIAWKAGGWMSDPQATGGTNATPVGTWRDFVAGGSVVYGNGAQPSRVPNYLSSVATLNGKPALDFNGTKAMGRSATVSVALPYSQVVIVAPKSKPATLNRNFISQNNGTDGATVGFNFQGDVVVYAGGFPLPVADGNDLTGQAVLATDYINGASSKVSGNTTTTTGNAGSGGAGGAVTIYLGAWDINGTDAGDFYLAFWGIYEGDVTANAAWPDFKAWAQSFYGVNLSAAGGGGGDVTPPSTPTSLVGSAPGPTQVNLSWNASTDNSQVTGYRVVRNGTVTAVTTATTYSDNGVTASNSYAYQVKAFDAAGNESAPSNTVNVVTPAVQPGGGGGGGGSRDPFLWPFSSQSFWNLPIGSGAIYEPANAPKTALFRSYNTNAWLNVDSYSIPPFKANPGDPTWFFTDDVHGGTFPVVVPPGAGPANGSDASMAILQPDGHTIIELWLVRMGSFPNAICSRIEWGDAYGMGGGPQGGIRAYGGSAMGGLIRRWEVDPGHPNYTDGVIRHALALSIDMGGMGYYAGDGSQSGYYDNGYGTANGYIWPATEQDWGSEYNYHGLIPMGSYFAIPKSTNFSNLGLTGSGLKVARALQDYGGYVTDYSYSWSLYAEPATIGTTFVNELLHAPNWDANDIRVIRSLCVIVTNSTPATPNGGGTRPIALAPALI